MQNSRFKNLYNRLKRKLLANIFLARILLLALVLTLTVTVGFIGYKIIAPLSPYLFGQNLVSSAGRTNVLLLGIRGQSSDGPDMTDTMIFVSIRRSDGQVTLISLPRDIWSNVINAKVNSAYHLGFLKSSTTGGLLLSKTAVSELSGTQVHYAVLVDFSLFTGFIETLGGVDIDVPKTFADDKYPIAGKENDLCAGDPLTLCRFERLHFEKGPQHMDGATALKYIRSRQSADLSEGTDFARSRRQQQLITAVIAKLTSQKPSTYLKLYSMIKSSVITDLKPANYLPLGKILLKSRKLPLQDYSVNEDNLLENPVVSEKYNYQWVLIPKNNDPKLIPDFFQKNLQP